MKNEYIRIRLTSEEKEIIKKQADNLRMNISQYVRFVLLNKN